MAPQSLNGHFFTFTNFVHPDDAALVHDHLISAFQQHLPLHIQYRIFRADGAERRLLLSTNWQHREDGALIFFGTLQDLTQQLLLEKQLEEAKTRLLFDANLQSLIEKSAGAAAWYINLVTRKITYSANFYKLHGLKPGSNDNPQIFMHCVHPEDRDLVARTNQRLSKQEGLPELAFRLLRPDGKIKYVKQNSKLLFIGEETVIASVLQEVTRAKVFEKNIDTLRQKLAVESYSQHQSEEMSKTGSWWWEIGIDEINWSENIYQLLGYKPGSELTLIHLKRAIHPEDQKLFADQMHMSLEDGRPVEFLVRFFSRNTPQHMKTIFRVMDYEGRKVFVGSIQDITAYRRVEEELVQRAKIADALAQNLREAILITDEQNTIVAWNRQSEKTFGLDAESVLGKNFFEVFPQLKTEPVLSDFNKALAGHTIRHENHISSLVFGRVENLWMIPLYDDGGKIVRLLHLMEDVTKEYRLNSRLQEKNKFIESLVEASIDRIIVLDRNMNYLYCNEKAASQYGLTRDELLGKNVLEVFSSSMIIPSFEHFREALKGEKVQVSTIEGLLQYPYDQTYLIPIKDDTGAVTCVLWIQHDISR